MDILNCYYATKQEGPLQNPALVNIDSFQALSYTVLLKGVTLPKYSHTTLFVPGLLTNEHREFPSAIDMVHIYASAIIDRSLHMPHKLDTWFLVY